MFTAALFTITKVWKQLKCPSVGEWIKQLWDITQWNSTRNSTLNSKKGENFTLCNSMDGPGEHYAK